MSCFGYVVVTGIQPNVLSKTGAQRTKPKPRYNGRTVRQQFSMPVPGFAPGRPEGHYLLKVARLLFRQTGKHRIVKGQVIDFRSYCPEVASHQARQVHDSEVASRILRSASSVFQAARDLHPASPGKNWVHRYLCLRSENSPGGTCTPDPPGKNRQLCY